MGGRFRKDEQNQLRKSLIEKSQHPADIEDFDSIPNTDKDTGKAIVAETGHISKRSTPLPTKLKAKLSLQLNRLNLFRSQEYRTRMSSDFSVPINQDPTSSLFGLVRVAFDPSFRDRELGMMWVHTDGVTSKDDLRDYLINEAHINYQKSLRKGRFSHGSSSLGRQSIGIGGGAHGLCLRRSRRLQLLQKQQNK